MLPDDSFCENGCRSQRSARSHVILGFAYKKSASQEALSHNMALSDHKIAAFPSPASHKLEAGGICPMEIKHMHPKSKSPDERAAQLKDIRNACIALITAQKKTAGKESA